MTKKILIFCLTIGLFWFSLYIYMPIVSIYATDLGANLLLVGMIAGAYGLLQMLLRIPIGILSDRTGKRKVFIMGGIVFAILAGLTMSFAQTPILLLLCRALGGVAAAAFVPFTVHFSLYFKPEEGPRAMGIINAVNNFGQLLAVLLCGFVVMQVGYRATFIIAVAVGVAALVLSFFISENKSTHTNPISLKDLAKVPLEGNILLLSVLGLISQYMAFATVYGFTPIIAKNLMATDFQVSMLLTLFIFPSILSSAISGRLHRRFGSRPVLLLNFVIFALACLLTPFAPSVATLFGMMVVGGFALGIIFPVLMGLIAASVGPEKRNTAMGFYQAVYGLGIFLGPVVVGIFSNGIGIVMGFAFTALLGFVAAGMSWKVRG